MIVGEADARPVAAGDSSTLGRNTVSKPMLGLSERQVRVIAPFVGGGFGPNRAGNNRNATSDRDEGQLPQCFRADAASASPMPAKGRQTNQGYTITYIDTHIDHISIDDAHPGTSAVAKRGRQQMRSGDRRSKSWPSAGVAGRCRSVGRKIIGAAWALKE
jgi:hypothetical protein